jgi:hypothetical protein
MTKLRKQWNLVSIPSWKANDHHPGLIYTSSRDSFAILDTGLIVFSISKSYYVYSSLPCPILQLLR